MDDRSYEYLKKSILKLTGINLEFYKSQQMRRRLDMFFAHSGYESIATYVSALNKDPEMLAKLQDFLTINVSEFFRDKGLFDYLHFKVIPGLLKKSANLRIWSAGCSRGEEAYSVAMVLETIAPGMKHKILATDMDENSMKLAREGGPYSASETRNIPPSILNRYFKFSHDTCHVADEIKRMVDVRRHNLLTDEFERGFDLILCRNVVIYFTDQAKRILFEKLFNSLRAGGILFIGGTEVILDAALIGFEQDKAFFYRKPEQRIILKTSVNSAGVI